MAEEGRIQLCISDDILQETARVLRRPKFGWPEEQIRETIRGPLGSAELVEPRNRLDVVKDDPTDNRIL
jgi:predicted nucleic acid-binding protein